MRIVVHGLYHYFVESSRIVLFEGWKSKGKKRKSETPAEGNGAAGGGVPHVLAGHMMVAFICFPHVFLLMTPRACVCSHTFLLVMRINLLWFTHIFSSICKVNLLCFKNIQNWAPVTSLWLDSQSNANARQHQGSYTWKYFPKFPRVFDFHAIFPFDTNLSGFCHVSSPFSSLILWDKDFSPFLLCLPA